MEHLNDPMQAVADWITRPTPVLTPAQIHASAVQSRYFQNTRATTSRLAGELRSEYDTVRLAALLRLVRRLGFTTARDVWNAAAGRFGEPLRATFRDVCQEAAGAVLARGRDGA